MAMRLEPLALTGLAAMALAGSTTGAQAEPKGPRVPAIGEAFGLSRSDTQDKIRFRNGDILRGRILNETIGIETPFGTARLPLRRFAAIKCEAKTGKLLAVNHDMISGAVREATIRFRIASSGAEIAVRTDKINLILTKMTLGEADVQDTKPTRRLFIMANGDELTGRLVEPNLTVRTDRGNVPLALDKVVRIRIKSGPEIAAQIDMNDGTQIEGTFVTETVALQLEVGFRTDPIPLHKLAKIYARMDKARMPVRQATAVPDKGFVNAIGMRLVPIRPGTFTMGSPDPDEDMNWQRLGYGHFGPQHEVTISRGFTMSAREVTIRQYQKVMGPLPDPLKGIRLPSDPKGVPEQFLDYPALNVSWWDAVTFAKKLSKRTGRTYRLPTEAEWEYACRAGSTTAFNFGNWESELADYGWTYSNAVGTPHPVGRKKPNAWGLYDMHGNAAEWCHDWYGHTYYAASPPRDPRGPATGRNRVVRGGSWYNDPPACLSSSRFFCEPSSRFNTLGFRVVCEARESARPVPTPTQTETSPPSTGTVGR